MTAWGGQGFTPGRSTLRPANHGSDWKGKRPMRLRKTLPAWLGLAGACLFVIGCGGSDIPDPGSDAKRPEDLRWRRWRSEPAPAARRARGGRCRNAPRPGSRRRHRLRPSAGKGGEPSKAVQGESTTSEMLAHGGWVRARRRPVGQENAEASVGAPPGGDAPGCARRRVLLDRGPRTVECWPAPAAEPDGARTSPGMGPAAAVDPQQDERGRCRRTCRRR